MPLHPLAKQIISLHNTTDDSKPIRDIIWFEIHELGFFLQFKHNLSYHQSYHTFCTLMVLPRFLWKAYKRWWDIQKQ